MRSGFKNIYITDGIMKKDYFQNKLFGLEFLRKKWISRRWRPIYLLSLLGYKEMDLSESAWRSKGDLEHLCWIRGFVLDIWEGKHWQKHEHMKVATFGRYIL